MVNEMFFLGRNFVSGLLCTQKSKKKPKTFPKKTRFFTALLLAKVRMGCCGCFDLCQHCLSSQIFVLTTLPFHQSTSMLVISDDADTHYSNSYQVVLSHPAN